MSRLVGAAAALTILAVTALRAPQWITTLTLPAALTLVGAGIAAAAVIGGVAVSARASTARRLALELVGLGTMLFAAELALTALNPASTAASARQQRLLERAETAHKYGLDFDGRSRSEVARTLREHGVEALPGVAQGMASAPGVRDHLPKGFYPLAHASNVTVVECNEGLGFLEFKSDEFGFNNPPGLVASGDVEAAVVGASLALGHCVPPDKSAVALVRERYPKTANFGIAGARVLSQLAIFREYVEPLRPPTVLWLVNPSFAEPKEEALERRLVRYLDPDYCQNLMQRQDEVDAAVRKIIAPVQAESDARAAGRKRRAAALLARAATFAEVRGALNVTARWHEQGPPPDLDVFERALTLVSGAVASWRGRLVVMILPSYGDTLRYGPSLARYDALVEILNQHDIETIDGAKLFRNARDPLGLYTLRIDNHPNERGHALLGEALIAGIEQGGKR